MLGEENMVGTRVQHVKGGDRVVYLRMGIRDHLGW